MLRAERALGFAERQIRLARRSGLPPLQSTTAFFAEGPREPIDGLAGLHRMLDLHEKLDLPEELNCAIFGAGVRLDSFLLAALFKKQVTAFEDPLIAHWLGLASSSLPGFAHLRFQGREQGELSRQEITEFDVICLYGFSDLTDLLLRQAKPETVIITHEVYNGKLFPQAHFRPIFPSGLRVDGPRITSSFYAFKRN
jgi:hypothetical protein